MAAMSVETFAPSAALAPFVRSFEVVETREEVTRTLLPETGLVLGFRFGGSAKLDGGRRVPDRVLTGLRSTVRRMTTSAGGRIVVAKFQPGGAAAFFEPHLHSLFGETCLLDEWMPREDIDRAEDRIAAAQNHRDRVTALENFLLSKRREAPDRVALAAVRTIQASPALRIRDLAHDLGVSLDGLEKRFRRAVGTTPKRFGSLVRLRAAASAYRLGASLTALSHDAGYFDQSHFIRDFRAATGTAPRAFFEKEAIG